MQAFENRGNTISGNRAYAHISSRKPKRRGGRRGAKAVEHLDFLSLLGKARGRKLRQQLIHLANKGQIDAVLECIENVNNHNVHIPANHVKKLRRYSPVVRGLKAPRTSLSTKKRLLGQSGGFLASLIPMAVSAIGGLINAFKK